MDEKYYATIDETHDGIWLADGYGGMMMDIYNEDYESILMEEWKDEFDEYVEEFGHGSDRLPKWEDHFIPLTLKALKENAELLRERGLQIASGVTRRLCEVEGPTKSDYNVSSFVRITKLDEDEMEELLSKKQAGNQLFIDKKYKEAAEMYDEALMNVLATNLYVSPQQQVKEVINCISNLSECHLRLGEYDEAATTATDALVFECDHVKSRIRRAKAELALYKEKSSISTLAQACYDLERVLSDVSEGQVEPCHTTIALETAQNLLRDVKVLLDIERMKYAEEKPDVDFDLMIRFLKSKCW